MSQEHLVNVAVSYCNQKRSKALFELLYCTVLQYCTVNNVPYSDVAPNGATV